MPVENTLPKNDEIALVRTISASGVSSNSTPESVANAIGFDKSEILSDANSYTDSKVATSETEQKAYTDGQVENAKSEITAGYTQADTELKEALDSARDSLSQSIASEASTREAKDDALQNQINEVAAAGQYTGVEAVSVSNNSISLKINPNCSLLVQDNDGLLCDLEVKYDAATGTLTFLGKNDNVIASVDLPVEQILQSAEIITDNPGSLPGEGPWLKLVFNTTGEGGTASTQVVYVDLNAILSAIEGGDGITVSAGVVSLKLKSGEKYLTVNADGLGTTGIDTAISAAVATETQRATTAEKNIDANYKAADASLQQAITAETTAREQADTALQAAIDQAKADGAEKLVLSYIEPVYGDDGVSLTNKEAFIEAWGPVMKKYRAAPDSYRLFMEMPSGIGTEMAEVPCQTVLAQDMGEEGQALLLSAYGVICVPSGYGTVPLGIFAGATIMFDASGEVMSVEYPAYAPAMTGTGMPNMVLQKVYINAEDFSKSGEELKTAMQPYIDAIRSNPMAEAVMVDAKNGWVVPMVVTKWMGDSDLPGGSKYILQGNLHHIVENEDEKIGGVSSFVAVCDVDASGTIVTASSFSADSDWATDEAMNTALANRMPIEEGWAGNADDIENLVSKPFGAKNIPFAYYPFLSFGGGGYKAQFNALNNSLKFRSTNESGAIREWVEIWHAGNFNPASKANAPDTLQNADLNTLTSNGLYVADGAISNAPASTANCRVLVIATSPYRVTQIAQVYDADRLFFRRRIDEQWQPWREVYHSGNLAPATAAAAGLMSAEDRIKLNSVASALSLPVVTEDMPTTLEMEAEDATRVMAVTPQACIRAQRAAQYQMQTDELLYDALEAFARNHPEYSEFAAWLEAKDRIRQEFPKPGATEVADGPETDGEPQNSDTEPAVEQNQKGDGE